MERKRDDRRTVVKRNSDCDLVVTRSFNAPARNIFAAWTTPDLFMRWWAPKSTGMTLLSCEMDVRVGGGCRIELRHPAAEQPMAFFGKYIEVIPPTRLTWTNEESEDGAVSTVTLEEKHSKTLLTFHERYPTKQALDNSIEGTEACMPEQFTQLGELLLTLS